MGCGGSKERRPTRADRPAHTFVRMLFSFPHRTCSLLGIVARRTKWNEVVEEDMDAIRGVSKVLTLPYRGLFWAMAEVSNYILDHRNMLSCG
jgi:hypothetical protein